MSSLNSFVVILSLVVYIGLYTPPSLYYIFKLYKRAYINKLEDDHGMIFLRQRYTSLSLVCALQYVFQLFSLSLWSIVLTDWYDRTRYMSVLISICTSTHIMTEFIITSSLALRFWLIHFGMKFQSMSQNDEWKKIINPNYQSQEHADKVGDIHIYNVMNRMQSDLNDTEWILLHKSSYGSLAWFVKKGFILSFLLLILVCSAELINHGLLFPESLTALQLLLNLCVYSIFGGLWSVLLFLHCRAPPFYDTIYIRKELSYILQIMMVFLFIYVVFVVIFGLGLSNSNVYTQDFFVEIILLFHVIAMSNMLMLYFVVVYPLRKADQYCNEGDVSAGNRSQNMEMSVQSKSRSVTATSRSARSPRSPKSPRNKNKNVRVKLDDVLRVYCGFTAFVRHLGSEFSIENIMSLTEFIQFKRYVFDVSKNGAMAMNKELRGWFTMFPLSELPKSEIVFDGIYNENAIRDQVSMRSVSDVNMLSKAASGASSTRSCSTMDEQKEYNEMEMIENVKRKAFLLFEKYIETGSKFEINVSYELRKSFQTIMQSETVWLNNTEFDDLEVLRDLFDDAAMIMKRLMSHSFGRFKQSQGFQDIKAEIIDNGPVLSPVAQ